MDKKFEESFEVSDWEVKSELGYVDIKSVHKTVPYTVWCVKTADGLVLRGADNHIVFTNDGEKMLKELCVGDQIKTINGLSNVITLEADGMLTETMYDLQVDGFDQSYYTDGILSHNTATAALYLLWYAMFRPDSNILIAAHKGSGADEIMARIRYAYESCPNHIRCGTTTYAASKIVFDNNSTLEAQTTTENTGRGKSISLLYCLDANTAITVRDKETGEIKDITLEGLYTELEGLELLDMHSVGVYRLYLSNKVALDVPSGRSIYVNDMKVTPDEIIKHEKNMISYGATEVEILDIEFYTSNEYLE